MTRLPLIGMTCAVFMFSSALLLIAQPAFAQISESKKQLITEFLDVSETKKQALATGKHMVDAMRQPLIQQNNLTEEQFEVVSNAIIEIFNEDIDNFLVQVIPVYDRHFSESELKELIAFYNTPTGKKIVASMPQIMNEIIPISQEWAISQMPKVQDRITQNMD